MCPSIPNAKHFNRLLLLKVFCGPLGMPFWLANNHQLAYWLPDWILAFFLTKMPMSLIPYVGNFGMGKVWQTIWIKAIGEEKFGIIRHISDTFLVYL